jgi:glycine/D-amino acid oxidase-like deaminating enzyme
VQWVKRSFELWKQSQERWQVPLYHRTGLLWIFSGDDAYATQSIRIGQSLGFDVEPVPLDQAERLYPQINLEGVRTLYYELEAGYLMARRACQAVVTGFVEEDGTYRQAAVQPGPIQSQMMQHVLLANGSRLTADHYVFACGPWLGTLLPDVVGQYIEATRQEVFFFGTPPGDESFHAPSMPAWIDFGDRLVYGIPGNEERGFKVADDTRGALFDPTAGDRLPSNEALTRARDFVARRFPRLASAPLLEARVCQYENSPDGHFIIDRHPEAQNVWIAGGGSGHGFKLGPALGEYLAALILGETPLEPFFRLTRLSNSSTPRTQFDKKP